MFNISDDIVRLSNDVDKEIEDQIKKVDEIAFYNQAKVIKYLECILERQQDMGIQMLEERQ